MKGRIEINRALCKGCELCVFFCPKKVIMLSDQLNAAGYLSSAFNDSGECTHGVRHLRGGLSGGGDRGVPWLRY
jgi:2-oxoglutarate ferredoxin oxidoreductase subunit delta